MNNATVHPAPFKVGALGEIAIRCADLEAMTAFYRDVIGLTVMEGGGADGIVFFDIGPGYQGHRTVLALFRHDAGRVELHRRAGLPLAGGKSSLHHLALTVSAEDQGAAIDWYDSLGLSWRVQDFDWIGWRGVFTEDPEGNTVELVAKVKAGETHD